MKLLHFSTKTKSFSMCSPFNGKILPYLWDIEKDMGILMLLLERATLNMGSLMPASELERGIFPGLKFHTNVSPELMDVKNTFESGGLNYAVCARTLRFLQASHSYTFTSLWKQGSKAQSHLILPVKENNMGILMLLLERATLNMGSLMPASELERDIFPGLKFHTNVSPELMDVKNTFESGGLNYAVCARTLFIFAGISFLHIYLSVETKGAKHRAI
ncbi:hypothetical protein E2320_018504 [Naja naja]|nr:hypothetical protein E2320_018504 [Naja naja]